jgi:hypothetical protein
VSLYADDAVVFIKPTSEDLVVANCILQIFADTSGLVTNMTMTLFFPIQCQQVDLEFLNQGSHVISSFSCSYLGFPLHIKKLPKSMFELVIQKIAARISGWKRNLLSYPERDSSKSYFDSYANLFPLYFQNAQVGS